MTSDTGSDDTFFGKAYTVGRGEGKLLASSVELSFWGGVNPATGEIIDCHHPLCGQSLENAVLAIPGGRGSCSGSIAMLELLLNGKCPQAIIFERCEEILTLGVMVAEEIFERSIPVVTLASTDFRLLLERSGENVYVGGGRVSFTGFDTPNDHSKQEMNSFPQIVLSPLDQEYLDGIHGKASQIGMRIILRMADMMECSELMSVSQAHIDACLYAGPGSVAIPTKLRDLGGKFQVPTTINSISIDQQRWRSFGIDSDFGEASASIAKAYTDMGALPTFTCAPYQLDSAPKKGENVGWGESNAVLYANSVLGARTMKNPDYLDVAIALTGRAPKAGVHLDVNRSPTIRVQVACDLPESLDDSFWPLIGYCIGDVAKSHIPVVTGLDGLRPSSDDLKAFGAAFGTSAAAPMFHIVGITPEAPTIEALCEHSDALPSFFVSSVDLQACWREFNGHIRQGRGATVDFISLGNPHFSLRELRRLASLCQKRNKAPSVTMIVTCGRSNYSLAKQAGYVQVLEAFGVKILTDTCWCFITEPIIPKSARTIMTNSGKYAHYGPGLTGKQFAFGSLAMCVDTACEGNFTGDVPTWLAV